MTPEETERARTRLERWLRDDRQWPDGFLTHHVTYKDRYYVEQTQFAWEAYQAAIEHAKESK